ncbi:hypothetical protein [Brevibacillus brevis]|uniref:Uncharacterized protein n=1 Tax=Brevibacillus brevis TaxID=1393 RepID=A0ABY9T5A5_BREBE|nr:hypothetical protein [Brevibacillus brevis]WNC15277.1 hypothetical protein RGB73_02560 [Brevibacillus brevis]
MIAKYIGEALLFVVSLPIIAFQTAGSLHALADAFVQMSDFVNWK